MFSLHHLFLPLAITLSVSSAQGVFADNHTSVGNETLPPSTESALKNSPEVCAEKKAELKQVESAIAESEAELGQHFLSSVMSTYLFPAQLWEEVVRVFIKSQEKSTTPELYANRLNVFLGIPTILLGSTVGIAKEVTVGAPNRIRLAKLRLQQQMLQELMKACEGNDDDSTEGNQTSSL